MYSGHSTYPDGTQLHVWLLDEPSAVLQDLCREQGLPSECDAKAESRRQELLAERLLLRRVLGRPATLLHDPDRAPRIEGAEDVHASVAHTRGWLGIALNDHHAMGLDVERYGRRVLNVRDSFLTPAEKQWLAPGDELGHLVAWTAKEAIFKAVAVRALVQSYRDDITLHPFATPEEVPAQMHYRGAFLQQAYDLTTLLQERFLVTLATPQEA